MQQHRRCGPWRETVFGRVRRCNNPLLPEEPSFEIARVMTADGAVLSADAVTAEALFGVSDDEAQPEPQPETTPPAERKRPPAIERVVITDRTNEMARKLIESVFREGEPS